MQRMDVEKQQSLVEEKSFCCLVVLGGGTKPGGAICTHTREIFTDRVE